MENRRIHYKCVAINCPNFKLSEGHKKFYKVPDDERRANAWLKALGRRNLQGNKKRMMVCEDHFSRDMILGASGKVSSLAVPFLTSDNCPQNQHCLPLKTISNYPSNEGVSIRITKNVENSVDSFSSQRNLPQTNKFVEAGNFTGYMVDNSGPVLNRGIDQSARRNCQKQSQESCQLNKKVSKSVQTGTQMSLCSPRKVKLRKQIQSGAKRNKALMAEKIKMKKKMLNLRKKNLDLRKRQQNLLKENKELKKENEMLKCSINTENKVVGTHLSEAEAVLSPEVKNIVKNEMNNSRKSKGGRRYSQATKKLALAMHYIAPTAYNFLSDVLTLPSKSTLQRLTQDFPVGPGIHDTYFENLRIKGIPMKEDEKNCVICIDEMSVKAHLYYDKNNDIIVGIQDDGQVRVNLPAKNAFVLFARGIKKKWKHPLGYVFVHNSCPAKQVQNLLFKAIRALNGIGFKPRLVVSDQGANFQRLTTILEISPEKPYFEVGINGQEVIKVYYMFDIPHLLKSVRNTFQKNIIKFDGVKKPDFPHVNPFYEIDSKCDLKLALKITREHMAGFRTIAVGK